MKELDLRKMKEKYPKAYAEIWRMPPRSVRLFERGLFDLFDRHNLYIQIFMNFTTDGLHEGWIWTINEHQIKAEGIKDTRTEAEAFEKAFELLEKQLNK